MLSGPQGTLFGQNSNAGVQINIVTQEPVFNRFEAIAHIDVGTHDFIHAYGVVNIPINDTLALRLSYHHDSQRPQRLQHPVRQVGLQYRRRRAGRGS